ncbi:hypothetical protein RFI_20519, partial [Reticulomyxa filosa]
LLKKKISDAAKSKDYILKKIKKRKKKNLKLGGAFKLPLQVRTGENVPLRDYDPDIAKDIARLKHEMENFLKGGSIDRSLLVNDIAQDSNTSNNVCEEIKQEPNIRSALLDGDKDEIIKNQQYQIEKLQEEILLLNKKLKKFEDESNDMSSKLKVINELSRKRPLSEISSSESKNTQKKQND